MRELGNARYRRQPPRRPDGRKSRPAGWMLAAFATGAASLTFLEVGAQLYISEILLIGLVVFSSARTTRPRLPSWIPVTLGLWLLGTIASDLVASTIASDAAKGILRIAIVGLSTLGILLLHNRDERSILSLWLGVGVAGLASFLVAPSSYAVGEPWKFGLATPATILAVYAASRWKWSTLATVSLLGVLASVHFVLGYRSLALICLATAILLAARRRGNSTRAGNRSWGRLTIVLVLGATVAVLGTTTYDALARAGAFGPAAAAKAAYLGGELGSLAGSRSEVYLAALTIAESPWTGVGTGGTTTSRVDTAAAVWYEALGYSNLSSRIADGETTSFHSMALGSIAENGLGALPFWIGVLALVLKSLERTLAGAVRHPVLVAFLATLTLWDAFFSPFGGDRRFWLAATLATIVTCVWTNGSAYDNSFSGDDLIQSDRPSSAMRRQRRITTPAWR